MITLNSFQIHQPSLPTQICMFFKKAKPSKAKANKIKPKNAYQVQFVLLYILGCVAFYWKVVWFPGDTLLKRAESFFPRRYQIPVAHQQEVGLDASLFSLCWGFGLAWTCASFVHTATTVLGSYSQLPYIIHHPWPLKSFFSLATMGDIGWGKPNYGGMNTCMNTCMKWAIHQMGIVCQRVGTTDKSPSLGRRMCDLVPFRAEGFTISSLC